MNYIKNLQQQAESRKNTLEQAINLANEFRAELMTQKYQGHEADGSLKSYMWTDDIERRLTTLIMVMRQAD